MNTVSSDIGAVQKKLVDVRTQMGKTTLAGIRFQSCVNDSGDQITLIHHKSYGSRAAQYVDADQEPIISPINILLFKTLLLLPPTQHFLRHLPLHYQTLPKQNQAVEYQGLGSSSQKEEEEEEEWAWRARAAAPVQGWEAQTCMKGKGSLQHPRERVLGFLKERESQEEKKRRWGWGEREGQRSLCLGLGGCCHIWWVGVGRCMCGVVHAYRACVVRLAEFDAASSMPFPICLCPCRLLVSRPTSGSTPTTASIFSPFLYSFIIKRLRVYG